MKELPFTAQVDQLGIPDYITENGNEWRIIKDARIPSLFDAKLFYRLLRRYNDDNVVEEKFMSEAEIRRNLYDELKGFNKPYSGQDG